ncbi:MAG: hypothetical protein US20_C0008G0038 [Candidatus Pacebacteria bacterium GW2011_GWF1_36_5]|nr:MAG: hypothetical protein US20_C0008G0038 [Candidatus Pacebacteria bacterium GW2011_GWF1_36_5]
MIKKSFFLFFNLLKICSMARITKRITPGKAKKLRKLLLCP